MSYPPSPMAFPGFFLALSNYFASAVYSSSFYMVRDPSSATVLAEPGASISKSISYPSYCSLSFENRPSFLTLSAASSLSFLSCTNLSNYYLLWLRSSFYWTSLESPAAYSSEAASSPFDYFFVVAFAAFSSSAVSAEASASASASAFLSSSACSLSSSSFSFFFFSSSEASFESSFDFFVYFYFFSDFIYAIDCFGCFFTFSFLIWVETLEVGFFFFFPASSSLAPLAKNVSMFTIFLRKPH